MPGWAQAVCGRVVNAEECARSREPHLTICIPQGTVSNHIHIPLDTVSKHVDISRYRILAYVYLKVPYLITYIPYRIIYVPPGGVYGAGRAPAVGGRVVHAEECLRSRVDFVMRRERERERYRDRERRETERETHIDRDREREIDKEE